MVTKRQRIKELTKTFRIQGYFTLAEEQEWRFLTGFPEGQTPEELFMKQLEREGFVGNY